MPVKLRVRNANLLKTQSNLTVKRIFLIAVVVSYDRFSFSCYNLFRLSPVKDKAIGVVILI